MHRRVREALAGPQSFEDGAIGREIGLGRRRIGRLARMKLAGQRQVRRRAVIDVIMRHTTDDGVTVGQLREARQVFVEAGAGDGRWHGVKLAALTDATREAYPGTFLGQAFASVSVFLDFLAHLAGERQAAGDPEPVAVVLDELPYLADVEPGLLTVLQHWWDANKRRPNLKLFIAGSYMAFMERQVLDARAPLYNRRTAAMRLEPMTYYDAALFFPRYSARENWATAPPMSARPTATTIPSSKLVGSTQCPHVSGWARFELPGPRATWDRIARRMASTA